MEVYLAGRQENMKHFEEKLREERTPFTLVLTSGERVNVRTHDHLSIPPTEDELGNPLSDGERADFFQVWGNGRRYRWIAFDAITTIEAQAPENGENQH
jgi:hypothetical protein